MNKAAFDPPVPKALHVPILLGGVAVLVITAVAVATAPLTEWFQASYGEVAAVVAQQKDAEEASTTTAPVNETRAKARCNYCGIIESTRQVGGGVHEVTVRLADRSTHVFSDSNPANWRPGERIILIGGGTSPHH